MKKKYLFISNSTRPTYEQEISREKIKLNNVSIPCIEAAQRMNYEVFMGINRINPEELECDYDVKFYNSNTYRSLFDIKSNYKAFKNLMNLLRREQIDVIHCNTPIGGLMGRLCGKLAKVPKIIYTVHGFHFYKGAPLINRTIFKLAERWMANYTDAIITINQEDYEAAQAFNLRNEGKVYYVPGVGININEYRLEGINKSQIRKDLGLSENDVIVISSGDLIKRKNYKVAIESIAACKDTRVHLLICGVGPELEKLKSLSKNLNIEKQIHFLGFRTDMKELLNISDIFLMTSYQEGLPRSMMEAMAAGLPCIASKIRGNVDLIDEDKGGYLCDPKDVMGFSRSITQIVLDKNTIKNMGEHNLKKMKKFDVEYVKKIVREIYEAEL